MNKTNALISMMINTMVVSINDQTRIEIYIVWCCSNQSARTSTCTLLIINQNYRDQLIYHDTCYSYTKELQILRIHSSN